MVITLSLVIYNPAMRVLLDCLHSLELATSSACQYRSNVSFRLSIIDNSMNPAQSRDIEQRIREHLHLSEQLSLVFIVSSTNGGYGHGNNLAIRQLSSKYHIVINPDVYLEQDSLRLALDFLEVNPHVVLLTPAVHGLDGERHYLCKRHPTLWIMFLRSFAPLFLRRIFRQQLARYEMRDHDYDQVIKGVQFPSGCCMLMRTAAVQAIGGFDERFFMYFEDADLGRRIAQHGEIHYVPSVRVIHKWERGTHNDRRLKLATIRSALQYWRKWGGMFYF